MPVVPRVSEIVQPRYWRVGFRASYGSADDKVSAERKEKREEPVHNERSNVS